MSDKTQKVRNREIRQEEWKERWDKIREYLADLSLVGHLYELICTLSYTDDADKEYALGASAELHIHMIHKYIPNLIKITPTDLMGVLEESCTTEEPETSFYTYALINPLSMEVFYIGKGKKGRAKQHLNGIDTRNVYKRNYIKYLRDAEIEPEIRYLHGFEHETEALRHERFLIDKYPALTNIMHNNGAMMIEDTKEEMINLLHQRRYDDLISLMESNPYLQSRQYE